MEQMYKIVEFDTFTFAEKTIGDGISTGPALTYKQAFDYVSSFLRVSKFWTLIGDAWHHKILSDKHFIDGDFDVEVGGIKYHIIEVKSHLHSPKIESEPANKQLSIF